MPDLPERDAFAAARHVLEPLAGWHPETGDLPVDRTAGGDWPTWLERAENSSSTWSSGEKLLLEIGTGIWTERLPVLQQLVGLDEENRTRVLEALLALSGVREAVTGGNVLDGRFGPQFTLAERAVIAETLEAFVQVVSALKGSGLFPAEAFAGVDENATGILAELIARLRS